MRRPSVSITWARLSKWFAKNLPEANAALNRGAPKTKIGKLERLIGQVLPDDFRESISIHDGENAKTSAGCVYGLELLAVDSIAQNWKVWDEITPIPELDVLTKSVPAKFVQSQYFNRGWIPITHDCGGNHIAIDLAPAEQGTYGQIIVFGRDDTKHYLSLIHI